MSKSKLEAADMMDKQRIGVRSGEGRDRKKQGVRVV